MSNDRYQGVALGVECAWPAFAKKRGTNKMRSGIVSTVFLVVVLVTLAVLAGCSNPHAGDRASPEVVVWATVERLEDLQLAEDSELPQYYEHPLAPDTQEEIVVRLDDGATLTVPNVGQHRYEAGQRVRVVVGSHGAFVL